MKIGMPRIRFTRKVVIVSFGMLALLGGSGAAALYVGAEKLIGEPQAAVAGGECTTIQTMVLKTPAKRLWLRKYVRMENADASMRIRTALRVAGVLAKSNPVDLIQVNVLDAHGPDKRADMRGRAIGAEVIIALEPRYLPEMDQPFVARYYEGVPSADGRFYGHKVNLQLASIQKLMTAMKRSGEELGGCIEPARPEDTTAEGGHGKPPAHGDKVVSVTGEHGAPTEGEHEAAEGNAAEGHGTEPAKEQSFLDSVLGMIGLGTAEEKRPESHEAKVKDASHAVADDAVELAPASVDHGEKPAVLGEEHAPAEADRSAAEHAAPKVEEHGAAAETKAEQDHGTRPIEQDAH